MTISAAFTVNGSANPARHTTTYGATVTLALVSAAGADSVTFSLVGASKSDVTLPTLTLSGSPYGSTATFTMLSDPLDGLGRTIRVECVVSSPYETKTTYAVVGVPNNLGILPLAAGEELDRDSSYGYIDELNQVLAGSAMAVTVNAQVGTSYTLQASDAGKMVTLTNASPIALTIPEDATSALPTNFSCGIYQGGAGLVTGTREGSDTIDSKLGAAGTTFDLAGIGTAAVVWKRGSGDWVVIGDVA